MIELYSLVGLPLYISYQWIMWSNQVAAGTTTHTLKERINDEKQELLATAIGAVLFLFEGEGMIDSVCDIVGFVWSDKAHELCTSIQVNLEGTTYVIGGAAFGSVFLFLIKLLKNKAKKKLQ